MELWLNVKILMNVKLEIQVCCAMSLTQIIDVLLGFVIAVIRALYLQCYIITASFFTL